MNGRNVVFCLFGSKYEFKILIQNMLGCVLLSYVAQTQECRMSLIIAAHILVLFQLIWDWVEFS